MISKANAQKLAWLWQDENKVAWIESFIKIADKEGKLVPFNWFRICNQITLSLKAGS